jgi:Mrp family chromosome partitioning ATPase
MGRVDAAMRAAEAGRATAPAATKAVIEAPATPAFDAPPPPPVDRIRLASVNFKQLAKALPGKIVVDENMSPTSREQYRRLAASLHQAQIGSGMRVVMISSALPGEGKTLTAANLSLTLSESYDRRVLLVDADLRRP